MRKSNYKRNILVYKLNYMISFFFLPIAIWPLYYENYVTFTELGIIYSISFFIQTILELPSGAIADLIGRKWTIIMAWITKLTYVLIIIIAKDFWYILFAEIMDKIGEALNSGSGVALIYDSLKENGQEKIYEEVESKGYFLATISFVFASTIGGVLYDINPKLPFIILFFVWAVGLITSLFFQEPKLDTEKANFKKYVKQNIKGFKHIFRNKKIGLTSAYSVLLSFVFLTGLWWLYQKSANEMNLNPKYVGILISTLYIFRAVGTNFYPIIKNFLTKYKIYFASFLAILQAIASFLLIVPNVFIALTGLALRYLSDGFRQPYLNNLQNKQIKSKYRATSLSAIALITSLLLTGFNPLIGKGIDLYGARLIIAITGFIPLLISFPLTLFLKKSEEK